MPSTASQAARGSFRPRRAVGRSAPHVDLAAEWSADDQPRPRDNWCAVCEWDGSWQNLLHRPQEPEEQRDNAEVPWIRSTKPYSRSSLDASARRGNLCCAAVLAFSKGRWGNDTLVTLAKSLTTTDLGLSVSRVLSGGGTGGPGRPVRRLFVLKDAEGDEYLPVGMPSLPMDLYRSVEEASGMCSRDSSMAWAKSRIDECTAGHPKCSASYTGFLPTRLIFVPLDAKTNGVSLRHRDSVPRHARYATLSHCWGPKESWPECQTTAHNYEQQLLGIPWTRIPQTFTDAIIITRQLGLEYIWIDSLCIIQQDESDWKVESVTMHQVYSNAHITLAAVDSHDSHGGLWLGPSLHWEMPDLLMTFIWKGRRYPLLLFSEPVHPTWGVVHEARFEPWDRPPLLTRAWAFQERVVSPRTLFFGKGSLVWDCFTESEVQPDRLAELLRVASIPCYGPKQHFADYFAASASPTSFRLWYQIVSQYTRLRLSVATDKLPGIAAIAQSIHASRPEDKYICGLWQSSFVHDLLWEPKYQPQYHQSYTLLPANKNASTSEYTDQPPEDLVVWPYTGPSWSWASSFTAVTFPLHGEAIVSPSLELIRFSINVQDGNSFGRVSPGSHIIVRASTLACTWKPAPSNYMHGNRCWLRVNGAPGKLIGNVCFKLDFRRWRGWDDEVWADAVLALVGLTEGGQARALVLHRFPNTKTYQRIGILVSPKDVMFNETCERLARIFEEEGQVQTVALT